MNPVEALFTALFVVIFGDHFWHSLRQWGQERTARALRGVLVGWLIFVLTISRFIRVVLAAFFGEEAGVRVLYFSLLGMALVIGFYLFISWRTDHAPR